LCGIGLAAAQDVASYRATFEASLAEIEAAHTQRTDALESSYLTSLEALYEQSRAGGDLAGTLAAKTEIDRLKAQKGLPAKLSDHAGVSSLQSKLEQALQPTRLERARQTAALADQYDQALDRLQRGYVVAEQLDEAQAVQRERDRAKALPSVDGARKAAAVADAAKPSTPAATAQPARAVPAAALGAFSIKDAKELVAKMDKLSEADWRKLPGTVVTVEADAAKPCDTRTELAAGDVVLLVPHPRDEWTPWAGRVEECDFRGLQGPAARPRLRVGPIAPMALCATVGRGFPAAVEGNYLVTGQGKLDLSPGLRAVRLEGGHPRGSIRVKIIPVGGAQ
jgi:hypothetical protein